MNPATFGGIFGVLAGLVGLWTSAAQAANPAIERLLDQTRRPVIADLLAVYEGRVPRQNPMLRDGYRRTNRFAQILQEELPRLIARFERVYPGARYAGLGRDSVQLVDLLDAFYHGRGQAGRVVRLDASGYGVNGASFELLADMLESRGASLDPRQRKFVPFVIFDATNFTARGGSQSTRILQAALERWRERGGDARGFIQRINVIASQIYSQNQIEADLNVEQVFALQQFSLEQSEMQSHQTETFSNRTTVAYTTAWHDTFGPLAVNPETGIVEGDLPRKKGSTRRVRRIILGELYDALIQTSKPEFQAKVEQAAQSLGYTLARSQVVQLPNYQSITPDEYMKIRFETSIRALDTLIQNLPQHPGNYMNAGYQLAYWITTTETFLQREAVLLVLSKLTSLRSERRLSAMDTKYIITEILRLMAGANGDDARKFTEILNRDPSLRSLFETRARRAKKGARGADLAGALRLIELGVLDGGTDCTSTLLGEAA